MKCYQIEITAQTPNDVQVALAEVQRAIDMGCLAAPWTEDEADSGYSFTSQGEFDEPTLADDGKAVVS